MIGYLIGIVLTVYIGLLVLFFMAYMLDEFGAYLGILLSIGGFFVIAFLVWVIGRFIMFLIDQSDKHIFSKMKDKPRLMVIIVVILYLALLIPALIVYLD